MPVIVPRSLNTPRIMNGTRCIVTKPLRNVIEVKIAAGSVKNETGCRGTILILTEGEVTSTVVYPEALDLAGGI